MFNRLLLEPFILPEGLQNAAAIGQGVFKRYLEGAMGREKQLDLGGKFESVVYRAEQALALLEHR